ncbi:MAG: hypothetical protein CMM15_15155 [Rhodospirillaceae bacterium]|nr:hypothetical protein [Rhodospirillaceae bacterium]|tara:strand:- start:10953 stop:11447 length:495 start_codon:yes stop_codon:yes gene_type:complete
MASIYGIDPIFDITYLEPKPEKVVVSYPINSLMHFLEKEHPKFAYLVKKAQFAERFASTKERTTLFLPSEDTLSLRMLQQFNIATCKNILRYHFIHGFFPPAVLQSSPYQQLYPDLKGQSIVCQSTATSITLNGKVNVLSFTPVSNACVYKIDHMMDDAIMGSS